MRWIAIACALTLGGCGCIVRLGYSPPMNFYVELQPAPPAPTTAPAVH